MELINFIKSPATLIAIGAILTVIGAFWSNRQQTASERSLREKSEEIIRLNQEINNSIIGGDSFCYVSVFGPMPETDTGKFMLVHEGEYNLYDLTVIVKDLEKMGKIFRQKNNTATIAELSSTETTIPVSNLLGSLIPSLSWSLCSFDFSNSDTQRFTFHFIARNGDFQQDLRARKINGEWLVATRVVRDEKEIYANIHPEFPRNADGEIEW